MVRLKRLLNMVPAGFPGLICLVSAVFLAMLALRFEELPVGACTDDAFYVGMARSLAAGHGPVIILHPHVPAFRPDVFPAGFPLLLAPVVLLFPVSLQALKIVPLLAALLLALVAWRLPAPMVDRRTRWLLVALALWNPWTVAHATRILSDAPYMAVSLMALLAYRRWEAGSRCWSGGLVGLAVLASLAVMIRTIGLALCVALIGHLLLRRRFFRAMVLTAVLAGLIVVLATADHAESGGLLLAGYRQQVLHHHQDMAGRLGFMAGNLVGYLQAMPAMLLPVFGNATAALAAGARLSGVYPGLVLAVGALLASLVGLGMIRGLRRDSSGYGVFALYLLVYMAGLLNFSGYPSSVQLRLLVPVLPLLYLFLIDGAAWLAGRTVWKRASGLADHRHAARIIIVLAAVALPMSLAHNIYRATHPLHSAVEASGVGSVDPSAGSAWVRAHTGPDEALMTQNPIEHHIHWRRPVVAFGDPPGGHDLSSLCARIEEFAVRYVFVGPHIHHGPRHLNAAAERMLRLLQGEPSFFEPLLVDAAEHIHIFGVRAGCPPSD